MSYIVVKNIIKEYGYKESVFRALKGLSFDIEKGEFVAIMGESGSGKSTLLSIMGAMNTPTDGDYIVDDIDVYSLNHDQRAGFRREYLGFIFQSFYLIPYLDVLENVMVPLVTSKTNGLDKQKMAEIALEKVGLRDKEAHLPGEISGGEQERVAIARAVVNEPMILLADEPTGNLDTKNSQVIMDLFKSLNEKGITIAMVTHSMDCAKNANRILHLSDGLLVGEEVFKTEAAYKLKSRVLFETTQQSIV